MLNFFTHYFCHDFVWQTFLIMSYGNVATADDSVVCVHMCICVWYRDAVREVVRLLLALNARSNAVSLAKQTNVSLAD